MIFDEKIVDSIQKYISDLISEYALGFELKDIDICGSDYNNDSYNDLFVNFDLIWNTVVPVPGVFPPIYQPAEGKNNIIMGYLVMAMIIEQIVYLNMTYMIDRFFLMILIMMAFKRLRSL